MDTKVIEKETQSLVSLADDLLCMTDPKKCTYTRDTYAFHSACLLTLERILIVLHGVECTRSKQWIVDFFQKRLRAQLNTISANQKYYPFVYNTRLILCNINGLLKGGTPTMLLNAGRRTFYALCGGLYLFQGIRELAVMRIDFAAMEAVVLKLQQAFGGMTNTWSSGLQEVVNAASESVATEDFRHIMKCYEKHKDPSFMARMLSEGRKVVKFALVSHLTLLATDTSASDLSEEAFRLLSILATDSDTAQWRAEPEIFECLLDALASVGAKILPRRQECLQLLRRMENALIRKHHTVMQDWRGTYSFEQKLNMNGDNESEIPVASLYDYVREHLGLHLTYASDVEYKQELIRHYQDESFAKVSLMDDVSKRHVANFDFYLVEYDSVYDTNRVSKNVSSTDGDQMAHNLERSQWVQKPIKLQDIFAERRQKPSGPREDTSRVLLLGNPGTGKTSLSKRLCHEWATCRWGSEFERVYLLPVRQLTESRLQLQRTLEGAVALLLFEAHCKSQGEQTALHHKIKDELDEQTTLLVIDGLDEANCSDAAEAIVRDVLSRSCCILVLSRPHNLGDLRSRVDVEIECLGLHDDHLKHYVRKEVPGASDDLIRFLKQSPPVWEIAKVPVNAQILCILWNSEEGHNLKESKSVNLNSLYSPMTRYAWKRFVDKVGGHVDHKEVFSSLETIAFKSISQSKIEIPLDLVMKYAQGTTTLKLLRDCGFLLFHKEGQVFQFAHLSFHEYFAGQFLSKNLRGDAKQSKKAKQYIARRKYYDTSRVTLSFMTQCYCKEEDDDNDEDCVENLKHLISILDDDPVEVVGMQHILLKMRTLDAFLSICGHYVEDIRLDDDLHMVVKSSLTALRGWLEATLKNSSVYENYYIRPALYNQIMEDLGQMPSLFACIPEFLMTVLGHTNEGAQIKLPQELEDLSAMLRDICYK